MSWSADGQLVPARAQSLPLKSSLTPRLKAAARGIAPATTFVINFANTFASAFASALVTAITFLAAIAWPSGTIHAQPATGRPTESPLKSSSHQSVAWPVSAVAFTTDEIERIIAIGPWPPAEQSRRDRSNRVSGNPAAAGFGQRLFESARLSANGQVSCASCHRSDLAFTDGLSRAQGLGRLDRNTPTLFNVALQRWFGWDGGADSLWAASIRPLLTPKEMGMDAARLRQRIIEDADWLRRYRSLFGEPGEPDRVLADIGKSIAAYLETLWSPKTAFDRFRDALADGRTPATAAGQSGLSMAAQRGLRLFVGPGNCTVCHAGANFSNGEFHDVAIPFMIEPGRVDPGRHAGIQRLRGDRFSLLGRFNDEPAAGSPSGGPLPESIRLSTLWPQHRNWGEWRTPSLRNLAATAPYMHAGSLASLEDVVRHYNDINLDRLHADGEQLLKPLALDADAQADLVAFLRALSN